MTGAAPRTHWSATDLMAASFPPPRWAVHGVLAEGVNLLAGQPKVGKSWLALSIAVSVASGRQALGKVAVDGGDVLYLALEDTPRRLQDRLRKILDDEPAPAGLAFATACPPIPDGGLDRIDRWLAEHSDARLVIIDVFARMRGGISDARASAYDLDYQAMTGLKRVADRHRVAVLLVHHTRKAASDDFLNEVSGTNGLAGAADAVLVLKRMRGSADAELHITGRDVDEAAYALSFDAPTGCWTMLDGPAADYALGGTRQAIVRHLRDRPGGTPKAIAAAINVEHNTVKVTLHRMTQDGQVDSDGSGRYFLPLEPVTPVTAVTIPPVEGYGGYEGYTLDGVTP